MKIYVLFILILVLSVTNAFSQYKSVFGEQSTQWNLLNEIPDAIETDSVYIMKDSTINGTVYKAVKSYLRGSIYFLRESEDNSKVFYFNPQLSDKEFKVLDLTLEKTDTFKIRGDNDVSIVVDSIYDKDGLKHIRFDFLIEIIGSKEHFEFIEGIGSNFGLFYQGISIDQIAEMHYLLCTYKDGAHVYNNNSKRFNGQCKVFMTNINGNQLCQEVLVYPNPANQILKLKAKDISQPFNLKIYDFKGLIMKKVSDIACSETIDVSNLPVGIYFYKLDFKDYVIYDKLIISR